MLWKKVINLHQNQVNINEPSILVNNYKIPITFLIFFKDKVFSFLSQDEVERMKAEEEQKIASLSRAEIKSWAALDENDDDEDFDTKYVFHNSDKLSRPSSN